jgi:hypothetical protein
MTIEKLTPEQEALIPVYAKKWIDRFKSGEVNPELVIKQINWLYNFCKLSKPDVYLVDSPMMAQVVANLLRGANVRANVGDNVGANVKANVGANVWANVWANVRNNVEANVGDNVWDDVWDNVGANVKANVWANVGANVKANVGANVRDNVWANVRNNVEANVRANVWNNVEANVWDNVRNNVRDNVEANVKANVGANVWEFHNFSSYGNIGDYAWISCYDYFSEVAKIDLKNNDFYEFRDLILSGVYDMIQFDKACIAVSLPLFAKKDANNRLHSVEGPAILFRDGYGQFYIRGRSVSKDLFIKLKEGDYTFEEFIVQTDEEIKSACIAFLQETKGDGYITEFFKDYLKPVDTFVDKKDKKYLLNTKGMNIGVYTLFKGEINNTEIAYIRCYCPSTDRMFFLGVDSKQTTAKDGIASLYRVPKKLQKEIKSIRRQGERYSTSFTDQGIKILKSLNKTEIQDTVSITGDNYFNLITYEY